MLNALKIQAKTNIIAAMIILAIALSSAQILMRIHSENQGLANVASSASSVANQIVPLTEQIAKMRLDVVQVQQFLSDISATRGQDGLDDGLKNAGDYATRFGDDSTAARTIAESLGLIDVRDAVEEVEKAFKPYYEVGQKMAHAYVDGGPPAGNAMMPQFDKIAGTMEEEVGKLETVVSAANAKYFNALQDSILGIQADNAHIEVVTIIAALVMVAVASLLMAFLLFGVTRPLRRLRGVMLVLAEGNLGEEVIYLGRGDEIGEMAGAVQVFKEHGLENERLKADQEAETHAKIRRQQESEELIDMFGSSVSGVFDALSQSTAAMADTANVMHEASVETNREVDLVTGAVGETNSNSQSVAAASQELSASIAEISRLINTSARVASEGSDRARDVEAKVSTLRDASMKIGDIIQIIANIASQTNLLALNATIEAARAGEAGKGFAVVATEVKNLAGQTQKATVDISAQIAEIQNSIAGTVDSVQAIGQTVAQIHHATSEIAAAVTEQHSATDEIARNVQFVSSSAEDIASSITRVRESADRTNTAASQVRDASSTMSSQAEKLTVEVRDFLTAIKGAGTKHEFQRLDLNLPARVTIGGAVKTARAHQLSIGGAWLDTILDGPLGSQVELTLEGVGRPIMTRIAGHTGEGTRLQFPMDTAHLTFIHDTLDRLAGKRPA